MNDKLIPLLVEILTELTQIRIALTTDLNPENIAFYTAKLITSKTFLHDVIESVSIEEV